MKQVQEGQWLCQGIQPHRGKFIMSKPALLTVITEEELLEAETLEREARERRLKVNIIFNCQLHFITVSSISQFY